MEKVERDELLPFHTEDKDETFQTSHRSIMTIHSKDNQRQYIPLNPRAKYPKRTEL